MVYGINSLGPLDLVPQPLDQKPSADAQTRVEEIKKLHEQLKAWIQKSDLSYQTHAKWDDVCLPKKEDGLRITPLCI